MEIAFDIFVVFVSFFYFQIQIIAGKTNTQRNLSKFDLLIFLLSVFIDN